MLLPSLREPLPWGRAKRKLFLLRIIRTINNQLLLGRKATERKEVIQLHLLIEEHRESLRLLIRKPGRRLPFLISWITRRKLIWMELEPSPILQFIMKSVCLPNKQIIAPHFMGKISMDLESLPGLLQLDICLLKLVKTHITITTTSPVSLLSSQTISKPNKSIWPLHKNSTWATTTWVAT